MGRLLVIVSLILSILSKQQRVSSQLPSLPTVLRAGVAAFFLFAVSCTASAQTSERAKEKQAAEAERAALRQKLNTLKREIHQTEAAKEHAADALAESEAAISDAKRSLRELAAEQKQISHKLSSLAKSQRQLQQQVSRQQQQLNGLLREQYMTGNEDRTKLLLSGDNPNRINRDLWYMGYLSKAQSKLLDELRGNLDAVEENKLQTERLQKDLKEAAREEQAQQAVLEQEKAKRAALLASLSTKLATQRTEAGNIERNEQRLGTLVNQLSKLIEQQRKADAERAARERATQRAEQKANTPAPPASRQNSQLSARTYNALTPEDGSNANASAFRSLRGKLRLPVRGELVAKYGGKRDEGPNWKGLFIRTEEGSEVKAIADGQVIFADWLRGFGNLVIIDHGDQYLTIYGNNQSLFKRAGEPVKTGDVIASTGASGGIDQPGLYFEMRHQGRPFDPLGWVTIR